MKTGSGRGRHGRQQSLRVGGALVAWLLGAPLLPAEELSPTFRDAVARFLANDYKGCQLAFARAAAEAPRAGLAARAAYGAACCAALRNDLDGGFESLALALANGFIDLERAMVDPRLETLRADSRWIQFATMTGERQQAHQLSLDPDLLRLYLEQQAGPAAPRREPPPAATDGANGGSAASPEAAKGAALEPALDRALARRREAWELVQNGRAKRPDDAFHAASILVESDRVAEVDRAAELARAAAAGDPDLLRARPLVAVAVDRGQMLAGRPQKYGTQLVQVDGKWKVYEVDPAITDDLRAEWGLPPIADAHARADELNRAAPPASPAPSPRP